MLVDLFSVNDIGMVYDMRNISWKPSKKWENLWSKIRYISRFNLPACCHHNFSKSDRSEKSQPWADCYFESQKFFFTKFISYSSHRILGCWVDYIKGIMKLWISEIGQSEINKQTISLASSLFASFVWKKYISQL